MRQTRRKTGGGPSAAPLWVTPELLWEFPLSTLRWNLSFLSPHSVPRFRSRGRASRVCRRTAVSGHVTSLCSGSGPFGGSDLSAFGRGESKFLPRNLRPPPLLQAVPCFPGTAYTFLCRLELLPMKVGSSQPPLPHVPCNGNHASRNSNCPGNTRSIVIIPE